MGIYTVLEVLATIFGIVCVFLQTQEKVIAWPFGLVSVILAIFVFQNAGLYSDVVLHFIYIGLNLYGWYYWSNKNSKNEEEVVPVASLSINSVLYWALFIILGAWVWGTYMDYIFGASFPYLDAFIMVGSLSAQYLLAKKVIQNWLLWIIVDVVAVGVYFAKGLYPFAFLFFVYLLLCVFGYISWKKQDLKPQEIMN